MGHSGQGASNRRLRPCNGEQGRRSTPGHYRPARRRFTRAVKVLVREKFGIHEALPRLHGGPMP